MHSSVPGAEGAETGLQWGVGKAVQPDGAGGETLVRSQGSCITHRCTKFLSFRISQAGELSSNGTYLKLRMGKIEQRPL